MSIRELEYDQRPGHNKATLIFAPKLFGPRLVYLTVNEEPDGGWVIRDFIKNRKLVARDSALTVEDFEEQADFGDFPPYLAANKENAGDWATYLRVRAKALLSEQQIMGAEPFDDHKWQSL